MDMVYVDDGQDTLILEGTFKNVAVESDNEMVLKNAVVTQLSVNAAAVMLQLNRDRFPIQLLAQQHLKPN